MVTSMARSKVVVMGCILNLSCRMNDFDLGDPNDEILSLVSEKHRDNFLNFFRKPDFRNMNLEFLAYWETDDNCKRAVALLLNPVVNMLDEMSGLMRELTADAPAHTPTPEK